MSLPLLEISYKIFAATVQIRPVVYMLPKWEGETGIIFCPKVTVLSMSLGIHTVCVQSVIPPSIIARNVSRCGRRAVENKEEKNLFICPNSNYNRITFLETNASFHRFFFFFFLMNV